MLSDSWNTWIPTLAGANAEMWGKGLCFCSWPAEGTEGSAH